MTARGRTVRAFSSRRPLALGFLTLVLLGSGLFGWGAFASISGAVIAAGRVEVATRDQRVEHIDGGTVREVLVRNGDRVVAGDVAIRLDDALLRSEEAILLAEFADLVARRNRLEAEFRAPALSHGTPISSHAPPWSPRCRRFSTASNGCSKREGRRARGRWRSSGSGSVRRASR